MPPEKSPRQPRKPFQNIRKKEEGRKSDRMKTGRSGGRPDKPFVPKPKEERMPKKAFKKERPYPAPEEGERSQKKVIKRKSSIPVREEGERSVKRPFRKERDFTSREETRRPVKRVILKDKPFETADPGKKYATRSGVRVKASKAEPAGIRLNKYIANSGICSRREADELIKAGVIKVNGEVVTTLGSKVMPGDKIQYGDQTLANERKRYLLLNKQKGYVTTTRDPHAKNTVMELIAGACKERIYPVGRLDRNTTGLLLFTNDGELAKKLMHPRSRIRKLYHVVLDQPVSKGDMMKIAAGIILDGEKLEVDGIDYDETAADRREVGIELHSGQNRVVRRIFESLGYKVSRLDRVIYAGLTKKNLPRGRWRFLTEKEVITLIMAK